MRALQSKVRMLPLRALQKTIGFEGTRIVGAEALLIFGGLFGYFGVGVFVFFSFVFVFRSMGEGDFDC